jgi:predicted ATPase
MGIISPGESDVPHPVSVPQVPDFDHRPKGHLQRIRLAGWKSIKDQTIDLAPVTAVIGANGAGKSNLLSLFRLLNALFARSPNFQSYVGRNGYADRLLHYGSRRTPTAEMELVFQSDQGENRYYARWAAAAGGALIFVDERVEFQRVGEPHPKELPLGAGHTESQLMDAAEQGDRTAAVMLHLVRSCRLFHFHDTSDESNIRKPSQIEHNRFLYPDAGNLASMLYLYQQKHPEVYRRIAGTVRQMVPEFWDFSLEPSRLNHQQIFLNWTQKGREYEFGPEQLSDGSLRFIALTALLLQPSESLPVLIALDEPELGLHPAAVEIFAGMARTASRGCQILLATQSPTLLDHFEPEHVMVAHTRDGASEFQRLGTEALAAWLDEYTLGEIWQKNVVGAGPYG